MERNEVMYRGRYESARRCVRFLSALSKKYARISSYKRRSRILRNRESQRCENSLGATGHLAVQNLILGHSDCSDSKIGALVYFNTM